MSLHVLPRNRCTPSIPPVLHVFESLEVPYIPSTLSKQLYFIFICKYLYTPQWPHEHFVQAKRISTIFWNNIIRVDDIPSTFTHLVGTSIQTNVWIILQNILISNFCNLAKNEAEKKSNPKRLSHQLIMNTSTRHRPYLQLLFLGSNQSNLSLSLQKPICLRCLYTQCTQPVTAFISNNKKTCRNSGRKLSPTSPSINPWFIRHLNGSLVETTPMS